MTLFLPRRSARTLYDSVSEGTAAVVIREYSSSFGLASRLLAEPVRTHVRNIYALVRVADEIVDNPDPTLGTQPRATMLDWLQDDLRHAMHASYSANLVVHAFARTARPEGQLAQTRIRAATRADERDVQLAVEILPSQEGRRSGDDAGGGHASADKFAARDVTCGSRVRVLLHGGKGMRECSGHPLGG